MGVVPYLEQCNSVQMEAFFRTGSGRSELT